MGRLPYLAGLISGPQRTRRPNRLVLCHTRHSIDFHARPCRHSGRPLDSGTENAQPLPRNSRLVYDCRRLVRYGCRRRSGICSALYTLHHIGGLFYAHHRTEQFGGLHRPEQGRTRHCKEFPAHPYFRYRGLYLRHAVRELHRLPEYIPAAVYIGRTQLCACNLLSDHACLPHQQQRQRLYG